MTIGSGPTAVAESITMNAQRQGQEAINDNEEEAIDWMVETTTATKTAPIAVSKTNADELADVNASTEAMTNTVIHKEEKTEKQDKEQEESKKEREEYDDFIAMMKSLAGNDSHNHNTAAGGDGGTHAHMHAASNTSTSLFDKPFDETNPGNKELNQTQKTHRKVPGYMGLKTSTRLTAHDRSCSPPPERRPASPGTNPCLPSISSSISSIAKGPSASASLQGSMETVLEPVHQKFKIRGSSALSREAYTKPLLNIQPLKCRYEGCNKTFKIAWELQIHENRCHVLAGTPLNKTLPMLRLSP
jgi:hypothetical protein